MRNPFPYCWGQFKRVVKALCDHPNHLQRWAIIGAGLSQYVLLYGMIGLLVWFGTNPFVNAALVIPIFGNIALASLAIIGLVVVALLGIIRGVKAMLPNGTSVEIDLTDKNDKHGPNDPPY